MIAGAGVVKINTGLLSTLSKGGLNINVFSKEILVLQCLVAGTSFCNFDKIEDQLMANAKLGIRRESKNEQDDLAVSIWFEETKVGYIPKNKNEVIARLMDSGKAFFATIEEKVWEGSWLRLEIKVFMKD
jgi:hypothetical protein